MVHQGAFLGELPNCTVLPRSRMIEASVGHLENQHGWHKLECLLIKLIKKVTRYRFQSWLFRRRGRILLKKNHYDAVVGFSEGVPTFMVSIMVHPNKIGWIHCDYSNYLKVGAKRSEYHIYNSLQAIVCVSDYTRESFLHHYPSLREKTQSIYNIIDCVMIREKALEPILESFDKTTFNIVSVGRLDPVKRLSIIPELAKRIVDSGCKVRWYVIGPQGTRDEVSRFLQNLGKYETHGIVVFLGERTNPYPYIARADLLVNTSISEACPYVINEAKILGTPVVCADFGSASEFIDNGSTGFIEPIDKMADRIIKLARNKYLLEQIRTNLACFKYDNDLILKRIYSLF